MRDLSCCLLAFDLCVYLWKERIFFVPVFNLHACVIVFLCEGVGSCFGTGTDPASVVWGESG